MTVSSTTNRNDYIGNGSVDTYPYTFKIFEDSDLVVTVREPVTGIETELDLTTHYTVTGAGTTSGGNVVLVAGAFDWLDAGNDLEVDWAITIRRVLPLTQETDIRNQGPFFPEAHEDQFDRVIMIEQQQDDEIGRSLKLPETVAGGAGFATELPGAIAESDAAGRCLIVNDDADGFDLGPTAGEVAAADANATAAAASAAAAAASAAAAALSAANAQNLFRDVTIIATGTYTVVAGDRGKILVFTGNCTVTLPEIATLDLTSAFPVTLLSGASGTITLTVQRSGTDTIQDGTGTATSIAFYNAEEGGIFVPDTDFAPDRWVVIPVHPRRTSFNQINLLSTNATPTVPTSEKLAMTNLSSNIAEKIEPVDLRKLAYVTKSSTFTRTIYEEIVFVDASGGAVTENLPTAVGNTGRVFVTKKTDSSLNAVTIDPNSTQTIGGASTTTLNTQGEMLRYVSDGTNWQIIERVIPSQWVTFTPTGSWVTNTTYAGRWRRVGDVMEAHVYITLSGAPTNTSLLLTIPSSLTINTSNLPSGTDKNISLGDAQLRDSGTRRDRGAVNYESTTQVEVQWQIGSGTNTFSATNPWTWASGDQVGAFFRVPISGWNT